MSPSSNQRLKYITIILGVILFLVLLSHKFSFDLNLNNWSRSGAGVADEDYQPYIAQGKFDFSIFEVISGVKQDDPRIIEYIQRNHMNPPASRYTPYNFEDKKMEQKGGTDPSTGQTSKRILKILGNKKNGIFFEAGAHNGEALSNTIALERDFNWTGILVEPMPLSFTGISIKNRKAWISDTCTSPYNTPSKMYFNRIPLNSIASQLELVDRGNFAKKDIDRIEVQCFPVYSLMLAANYTKIDFFSLDVEGVEMEVLRTIPWDKVHFNVITVEVQFMDAQEREILKKYMTKQGYKYVDIVYFDFLFLHKSINEEKIDYFIIKNILF